MTTIAFDDIILYQCTDCDQMTNLDRESQYSSIVRFLSNKHLLQSLWLPKVSHSVESLN
jgi:hypothetical protein